MLYLATELRHSIPKTLLPYTPMGDLLNGVATNGLSGYLAMMEAEDKQEQVKSLYEAGKNDTTGKATLSEYKALVVQTAYQSIEKNTRLSIPEKLRLYSQANQYLASSSIIEESMFDLLDGQDISTKGLEFPSYGILQSCILGNIPYGSLGFIAADTKTGKTRVSIKWAMEGLLAGHFKNLCYVSLEMKEVSVRKIFSNFHSAGLPKNSKVVGLTGTYHPSQIQVELENTGLSSKDTFVIFDSPDILAQGEGGANATPYFNTIMGELVRLSQTVGMVLCPSQVVRGAGLITSSSQLSLSSAKAQYADFVVGMFRPDHTKPLIQLTGVVNRNDGVGGCTLEFDHKTLSYRQAQVQHFDLNDL